MAEVVAPTPEELAEKLKKVKNLQKRAKSLAGGERNRQDAARRSREKSEDVRDIGQIPAVVNPERRERARTDTPFFMRAYFPETFTLPFSPDQLTAIEKADLATWVGGQFAIVMPRGSGKTSVCEAVAVKAVLYGRHPFVAIFGATAEASRELLASIKRELETNELLLQDFPEAVYPIRCLEGEPRRCKGQTYKGENTYSQWGSTTIVLATIPDTASSGSVIRAGGITGRVRGLKHKRPDGVSIRPSLVIIDDPQTDSSASSAAQCNKIERTLSGAILGLAGPGKKISAILPGTIIRNDDAMHRIVDHKQHPEWGGSHFKMVYAFPENQELWNKYREVMNDFDPATPGSKERAAEAATEFYREHREEMDRGARTAWPERHNPDELSAIQNAMNLLFRDERAFWAEGQGEPKPEEEVDAEALTADYVAGKFNRLPRFAVPHGASRLTAFVDVQGNILYYVVCAWADDFTGAVVDYGTYPDQKRPYFTLREVQKTLAEATGKSTIEEQLYAGLKNLTEQIIGRPWRGEGGAELRIERCHVDAGFNADVVREFCRRSQWAGIVAPSFGKGVGASSNPLTPRKPAEGERQGLQWYIPVATRHAIRHTIYDSNFWKTFAHARLRVGEGGRGGLSLFGDSAALHRMFADHVTSELRVKVTADKTGRTVDEWKLKPGADNHWLDGLVGCCVAASVQGVSLDNVHRPTRAPAARERISMDEMKRRARGGR